MSYASGACDALGQQGRFRNPNCYMHTSPCLICGSTGTLDKWLPQQGYDSLVGDVIVYI